ncbi:hypothetical protein ABZW03_33300 [Kitasatospora sp. NPDC004799]|uniref:hypothetical protein n=1 Tax=Kitasatospora sp. NPDC004799 TaxID=3154460 RepID=UPI0033BAC9DA
MPSTSATGSAPAADQRQRDRPGNLVGAIGRRLLADLMPDRRIRTRPRVGKRAISEYNAKGTVDRTGYKATISIDILTAPDP